MTVNCPAAEHMLNSCARKLQKFNSKTFLSETNFARF